MKNIMSNIVASIEKRGLYGSSVIVKKLKREIRVANPMNNEVKEMLPLKTQFFPIDGIEYSDLLTIGSILIDGKPVNPINQITCETVLEESKLVSSSCDAVCKYSCRGC